MLVPFAIITPIASFTDFFATIPGVDISRLTESYWDMLKQNPELGSLYTSILLFAGPIILSFLIFWYLWIQRDKEEVMLAIYARAMDVHQWLQKWTEVTQADYPKEYKAITLKARRTFKKLDRLLLMENRKNWRWWYSVYLTYFYFLNGPKLSAFREIKVDPPSEHWPTPEDLSNGFDRRDLKIAKNALDFSSAFTDGAKAWAGHEFMYHTLFGSIFTGMMAVIAGAACVLLTLRCTGAWSRSVLVSLTCSLILGWLIGYFWQCTENIIKKIRPASANINLDAARAAAES